MSAVLRGQKNFQVTTTFGGGKNKADDVLICTVAFFEVQAISLVARLFRLSTGTVLLRCLLPCCFLVGEFGLLVFLP
jgi:hypothetical protein